MKQQLVFKALADGTRRDILRVLRSGSKSAGELSEEFSITKASLSHHLALLLNAELVRRERRGQQLIYSLNSSIAEEVMAILFGLFSHKEDS
ncbi:transcriptional regulator [Idiomarina sp. MD25a]|uniref:autorepressor SdpR family transcription factor n=1 Tax=Idiomarina sp. MD25a TaxID=1889913 RepID=UPI0008F928FE|nr:autorepressor SdpR family transcription factor [Idiomarina sp. MD25a]OIM99971.1 transcriptional regulator [Idiomarina sp. MD25a]